MQVRHAAVNYIDETPWFLTHALQWLWVMVSDTAALYLIHPHRSKEAFAALIDDWTGILNRSTRDSYTRCHGNTDIARLRMLLVCQWCVARFSQ